MKTLGVVIARFQAHQVTPAHEHLLKAAMGSDRVLVLLGVHPVVRKKDLLDFPDRFHMVWQWWEANRPAINTRERNVEFLVLPAMNHPDDRVWATNIDQAIEAMALGGKVTLYCGPDGAGSTYTANGGRHEVSVIDSFEKHATSVRAALLPRATEDYRVGKIVAGETRFVNPFLCVDALVLDGDGLALLARKRTDPANQWRMVGGFVDPGETLEQAIAREVHEETALTARSIEYVGSGPIADWRYAGGPESIISACFLVTANGAAYACDDVAEVQWFPRADLVENRELVHPNHRALVTQALQKITYLEQDLARIRRELTQQ